MIIKLISISIKITIPLTHEKWQTRQTRQTRQTQQTQQTQ